MSMDVSIVIPSYNARRLLRDCLASIRDAETSVEYEVIVVDNASSDGSADLVKDEFPQFTLVENEYNKGFSAACNLGIRRSSGRYVLLLNSDTRVLQATLDNLVAFADARPLAGVIGCRHLSSKGNPVTCFAHGFLFPRVAKSNRVENLRHGWVSGACMLLRREACEKVGWLDEDFFFGSEDVELCWRMLKSGWEVLYTPDASIVHLGSGSSKGFNPRTYYEARRGSGLLMMKHGTPAHRLVWSLLMLSQTFPEYARARLGGRTERLPVLKRTLKMAVTRRFD